MPHICPYCGLNSAPLAYHESFEDCQNEMRVFTSRLREILPWFNPFLSEWVLDPWDTAKAGDKLHKELSSRVGVGPEFEGKEICLVDPKTKQISNYNLKT